MRRPAYPTSALSSYHDLLGVEQRNGSVRAVLVQRWVADPAECLAKLCYVNNSPVGARPIDDVIEFGSIITMTRRPDNTYRDPWRGYQHPFKFASAECFKTNRSIGIQWFISKTQQLFVNRWDQENKWCNVELVSDADMCEFRNATDARIRRYRSENFDHANVIGNIGELK